MPNDNSWVVIYPNGDRSRSFETRELTINWLASLRNMQPDIKCVLGPESRIVSRESVWSQIKSLYESGYMP
jgi:hypothetical protein